MRVRLHYDYFGKPTGFECTENEEVLYGVLKERALDCTGM